MTNQRNWSDGIELKFERIGLSILTNHQDINIINFTKLVITYTYMMDVFSVDVHRWLVGSVSLCWSHFFLSLRVLTEIFLCFAFPSFRLNSRIQFQSINLNHQHTVGERGRIGSYTIAVLYHSRVNCPSSILIQLVTST